MGDSPKRPHHLRVLGGYTLASVQSAERNRAVISHGSEVQASYSSIRTQGHDGLQWWVTEPCPDDAPAPQDVKALALARAQEFGSPMTDIISATDPECTQYWMIRDREPLAAWSVGRVTLAGDAAHATSPYAAYGAGMAIGDGYLLAKLFRGVDLLDTQAVVATLKHYDELRIPHTTDQVQMAFMLGQQFHHTPPEKRAERDHVLDNTPFLQEMIGDRSPAEIVGQLDAMGADTLA